MPKIYGSHNEVEFSEDGSIKKSKQNFSMKYESEPNYVKLYLNTVLYISDLPKGYNSILLAFLDHMSYARRDNNNGGQLIYINSAMKKGIASELNISVARINQALTDLVKGEVFYRVDRGTYQVNPHLFGRGDWQDIKEIRMEITFNAEGKTVMSEVEKKSNKPDLRAIK